MPICFWVMFCVLLLWKIINFCLSTFIYFRNHGNCRIIKSTSQWVSIVGSMTDCHREVWASRTFIGPRSLSHWFMVGTKEKKNWKWWCRKTVPVVRQLTCIVLIIDPLDSIVYLMLAICQLSTFQRLSNLWVPFVLGVSIVILDVQGVFFSYKGQLAIYSYKRFKQFISKQGWFHSLFHSYHSSFLSSYIDSDIVIKRYTKTAYLAFFSFWGGATI